MTLVRVAVAAASSAWAGWVGAAETQPPLPSESLGQVVIGLLFVLLLIFALAWLLRRMGGAHAFGTQGMKVIASLPLGTRERLVLVQVGGKQMLLGVAPGRVNLLESFDEPLVEARESAGGPFAERLRDALQRRGK